MLSSPPAVGGDRIARCYHRRCNGPFFGSLPYLVVVPAGKGVPPAHAANDAATGKTRACKTKQMQFIKPEETTEYRNSAEFGYLPTAADDLAQQQAAKAEDRKNRKFQAAEASRIIKENKGLPPYRKK
jgi:hypothetical protein